MARCPICSESLFCLSALWLHLKIVHSADKNQHFRCNEVGCGRAFLGWTLFRKHLQSVHKIPANVVGTDEARNHKNATSRTFPDSNETESMSDLDEFAEPMEVEVEGERSFLSVIANIILLFVLKLYSNHQLPRSHVQEVIDEVRNVFLEVVYSAKEVLSIKLREHGLSNESISEVVSILDSLLTPFSSFSTEYRRFKTLKESGCLVPFESYVVGDRIDDKMVRGHIIKQTVSVEAYFIPLRNVLKKLFSLPGVLKSVKSYMKILLDEKEIVENFVQGKLWRKKIQEHFKEKFVIPLFVYFDDFEINNALGSHVGIQKLGALYYSIPCFPPEVRSLLDNIFMAGLFHSYDRVTFKNHRIFHKIIEELNFLQTEGIEVEGCQERIYFSLGLLLGDNLGLNSILGFVESFSSFYYCRLCKLSREEIQNTFSEMELRFNTYKNDVLLQNTQLTGIKEMSVWDSVLFFKSVENYAVDFLHDGPEGWGKEIVTLVLYFFHKLLEPKDLRLSLRVLNGRLRSFDYHHNCISNKPPDVSAKEVDQKSLKMSGSEMQNFILIFAMLVGDIVPQDCKEWKLYCMYRQVMDIIMCRKLRPSSDAVILQSLVGETLALFKELFPNESIKPKAHNFTHYGTVMEQSGPIINLSTANFERKHRDKKMEARATTSRKCITQTLTIKEQLNMANRFFLKKGLESCEDYGGEKCLDSVSLCEEYEQFKTTLPSEFSDSPCMLLNWVKVRGITYRKNTCVVIRFASDDDCLPVFGSVCKVLQNENGNIVLVCKMLYTYGFSSHFHAYDVELSDILECVYIDDLVTPFPVIVHRMGDGTLYATVTHKL